MTSCTFKAVCRNYCWITLICVAKIKVIAFQMNTYINSTLSRYIVLHPIPPSIAYFSNNELNLLPMQFTLAIFSYVDVKFVINSTGKSKWFCAENVAIAMQLIAKMGCCAIKSGSVCTFLIRFAIEKQTKYTKPKLMDACLFWFSEFDLDFWHCLKQNVHMSERYA